MNTLLKFERLFVPFDLNRNIFAIFKFFTEFRRFWRDRKLAKLRGQNRFLVHGVVSNQGNPAKEQGLFLE